jgi:hypothetical protein
MNLLEKIINNSKKWEIIQKKKKLLEQMMTLT